jgi:hypothetical protein
MFAPVGARNWTCPDAPFLEADFRLGQVNRVTLAVCRSAEVSTSVVQTLATEAGAVAIFETNGLERAVRDMHAAVKHVAMSPYSYVVAGRLFEPIYGPYRLQGG